MSSMATRIGGRARMVRAVSGGGWLAVFTLTLVACAPEGRDPGDDREASDRRALEPEREREELNRIANLGYLGSPAEESSAEFAEGESGVVIHERARAFDGYNLFNPTFGPLAFLMDMEGRRIHRWEMDFEQAFGSTEGATPDRFLGNTWRRVRLLPDGSLLAIFEGSGLVKMDRDSNLIWVQHNGAHHDLDIDERGVIHVICREVEFEPRFGTRNPVLLDYIRIYSPEGKWLDSIPIDEAYVAGGFPAVEDLGDPQRDIYHTNTIQILNGALKNRHPAFRKGNLLLSFRTTSEIAVLDPTARRIVWRQTGPWREQHEPVELPGGTLLLYDNLGTEDPRKFSRVLEFDPFTLDIVWEFEGPAGAPFVSYRAGSAARLPNGNTLVVASLQGRALEVTPEKEIVWEYLLPERRNPEDKSIAGMYDLVRVERGEAEAWLGNATGEDDPG